MGRTILAAAVCAIFAFGVRAAEQAPPPTPQETERRCHDYTLLAEQQIAACTRIMGLYGTASANQPLLSIAYLARGSAHYRKGELEPAASDFRQAIQIDSMAIEGGQRDAGQYNERCWARAVAMIELTEALQDCNEALRIMPGSVDALDSRAFLQLRRARFRDALADYDAALKASPMDNYSLYGRGIAKSEPAISKARRRTLRPRRLRNKVSPLNSYPTASRHRCDHLASNNPPLKTSFGVLSTLRLCAAKLLARGRISCDDRIPFAVP